MRSLSEIVVTYCSVRWNGIIYWINAKQFSDHIGGKISLEATPKQNNKTTTTTTTTTTTKKTTTKTKTKTEKLSAAARNILDSCFGFRTEGTQFSFCLCSTLSRKGGGGGREYSDLNFFNILNASNKYNSNWVKS